MAVPRSPDSDSRRYDGTPNVPVAPGDAATSRERGRDPGPPDPTQSVVSSAVGFSRLNSPLS